MSTSKIKDRLKQANEKNMQGFRKFFNIKPNTLVERNELITDSDSDEQNVKEIKKVVATIAIEACGRVVGTNLIQEDNEAIKKLETVAKKEVDKREPEKLKREIEKNIEAKLKELASLGQQCERINAKLKEYIKHPIGHSIALIKIAKIDTEFCKLFKEVYVSLPESAGANIIAKLMYMAHAIGEQAGESFCRSFCAKAENILLLAKPIKSIISVCATLASPPLLGFGFAVLCGSLTGIHNAVSKEDDQKSLQDSKNIESKSAKDKIVDFLHILSNDFNEILKVEQENVNCITNIISAGTKKLIKDKQCEKYLNIIFNVLSKPARAALKIFSVGLATKNCFYMYTKKLLKATAISTTQMAMDFAAQKEEPNLTEGLGLIKGPGNQK